MAARRLIPLLDRVLIEKLAAPQKTVGGILLPETAAKINEGKVVAVGPGRRSTTGELLPMNVKEGDTVMLPEYGGAQVKLGDKELLVYREDEIVGVLSDK